VLSIAHNPGRAVALIAWPTRSRLPSATSSHCGRPVNRFKLLLSCSSRPH